MSSSPTFTPQFMGLALVSSQLLETLLILAMGDLLITNYSGEFKPHHM